MRQRRQMLVEVHPQYWYTILTGRYGSAQTQEDQPRADSKICRRGRVPIGHGVSDDETFATTCVPPNPRFRHANSLAGSLVGAAGYRCALRHGKKGWERFPRGDCAMPSSAMTDMNPSRASSQTFPIRPALDWTEATSKHQEGSSTSTSPAINHSSAHPSRRTQTSPPLLTALLPAPATDRQTCAPAPSTQSQPEARLAWIAMAFVVQPTQRLQIHTCSPFDSPSHGTVRSRRSHQPMTQ